MPSRHTAENQRKWSLGLFHRSQVSSKGTEHVVENVRWPAANGVSPLHSDHLSWAAGPSPSDRIFLLAILVTTAHCGIPGWDTDKSFATFVMRVMADGSNVERIKSKQPLYNSLTHRIFDLMLIYPVAFSTAKSQSELGSFKMHIQSSTEPLS